jgi:hypothetical protein
LERTDRRAQHKYRQKQLAQLRDSFRNLEIHSRP